MADKKKLILCLVCAAAALAIRSLALLLPNQFLLWGLLAITMLSPVGEECGLVPGLGVWLATSVAALLLPNFECGLLVALYGFYPIMRPRIAALQMRSLRSGMMLLIILCSSLAEFLLLGYLFGDLLHADASGELFLITLGFTAIYLLIVNFFSKRGGEFWRSSLRFRFFDE
ncbi:MAG: hypothetical protein IKL23_02065 [Oscillospiraceae bacterium]|nr:hypothetical protein [Oscillospiraceae bacterium]